MAFGVTPDGFVIKPLATIQTEIEDQQRADIDPGLDLDARSAQGQINGIMSAAFAELWEVGLASYSAAYPDSANDASLDNVSSITGTQRSSTTKTLVENVSVTLNPNAALPAGSVANIASQPNARFVSLVTVPADINGGVFLVDFEAETAGATVVAIGQLTEIAEPVVGWTAVNNLTAGITGEETESDPELRIKRSAELEGGGSTNVNSIRANLLGDVAGVIDAAVFENDTDDVVDGIKPHSVRCILRGGNSQDIAQSIFDTKAGGIATTGAIQTDITDSQGILHPIFHDTSTDVNYFLDATIAVDPLTFDTVNGVTDMEAAVATYVNDLNIGGDVVVDQVRCALLSITGTLDVTSLLHGFGAPSVSTNLPVDPDEKAVSDVANMNLTTVP